MRVFIKYLSLFINLFFILCLYLAVLCTKVSPEKNLFLPYFGLAFPFFFVVNVLFVFFWVWRRKWLALVSLCALVTVYSYFDDRIPVSFHFGRNGVEKTEISLLTYNVSLFGEERMVDEILTTIEQLDADVVCLQEFGFYARGRADKNLVLERLRRKYPYRHLWYKNQRQDIEYGVATFSKYPIVNKKKLYYPSQYNISIFSDVVVGEDTIRVFNNHLESTKLSVSEKKEVRGISESDFSTQKTVDLTERLSKKLGKAYRIRARQADEIAYEIRKSPYKTIVCGDFNDMPVSYVYEKIRGRQKDVFVATSTGYDYTFREGAFLLRIDHLFVSPEFTPVSCEIKHVGYSDHEPILGKIKIGR